VREGVGREQVAEFVVELRLGQPDERSHRGLAGEGGDGERGGPRAEPQARTQRAAEPALPRQDRRRHQPRDQRADDDERERDRGCHR
jgi:hypothetical protein